MRNIAVVALDCTCVYTPSKCLNECRIWIDQGYGDSLIFFDYSGVATSSIKGINRLRQLAGITLLMSDQC